MTDQTQNRSLAIEDSLSPLVEKLKLRYHEWEAHEFCPWTNYSPRYHLPDPGATIEALRAVLRHDGQTISTQAAEDAWLAEIGQVVESMMLLGGQIDMDTAEDQLPPDQRLARYVATETLGLLRSAGIDHILQNLRDDDPGMQS